MTLKGRSKYPKRKSFRRQVELLKRAKIAQNKVVRIEEFKDFFKEDRVETILVVDDDESIRSGLRRILESEGYQVVVAEDGLGLSRALEETLLDLILLDVDLPWVDGYELCNLIKHNELFRAVPVVMISGNKSEKDVERAFQAGCDHFLGKPFNVESLLASIESRLAAKCLAK